MDKPLMQTMTLRDFSAIPTAVNETLKIHRRFSDPSVVSPRIPVTSFSFSIKLHLPKTLTFPNFSLFLFSTNPFTHVPPAPLVRIGRY